MGELTKSDLENYDESEGIYTGDNICCPHCGKEQEQYTGGDPIPEMFNDGAGFDFNCDSCGREFYVVTTVTYSYDVFRELP